MKKKYILRHYVIRDDYDPDAVDTDPRRDLLVAVDEEAYEDDPRVITRLALQEALFKGNENNVAKES